MPSLSSSRMMVTQVSLPLSTRLMYQLIFGIWRGVLHLFLVLLTGIVTTMQSTRLRSISEWRILLNNNNPFQLQAKIHSSCQNCTAYNNVCSQSNSV